MKYFWIASFLLIQPAAAQGWRSIGPGSNLLSLVNQVAFDKFHGTLYAVTDSAIIAWAGDTVWNVVNPRSCYSEYGFCDRAVRIYQHPSLDSLWFIGRDDVNIESNPYLVKTRTPAEFGYSVWWGGGFPTSFSLLFDPGDPSRIYADLYGFGVSGDTGETWIFPLEESISSDNRLLLDELNPQILYAVSQNEYYGGNGLSRNATGSWTTVLESLSGNAFTDCLVRGDTIVIAQARWKIDTVQVHGILRSVDGGVTWEVHIPGINIGALARHPADSSVLYAGAEGVVFRSSNHGATWHRYNDQLPQTWLTQLVVDPASDTVYTPTRGYGVLQIYAQVVGVPLEEVTIPHHLVVHDPFPNPFNPSTKIPYELSERSYVTVRLFDILGRELSVLRSQTENPGVHSVEIRSGGLSGGTYVVVFEIGNSRMSRKILLIR